MIYLVTKQTQLFDFSDITNITMEESLNLIKDFPILQCDSETTGRDPHICDLLCFQIGDDKGENQIVIDCTTIDIKNYKKILESKYLVFQNAKFDLQFLYKHNIVPRKVYDTMIVEQFLYLGYPSGSISYALDEIAWRYLSISIDKSVRGEIIWRGLDESVIKYAANDVKHLVNIMKCQISKLKTIKNALTGAKIECDTIPAIAYLEWCGVKLDESKWEEKMIKDKDNLDKAVEELNSYVMQKDCCKKWVIINTQGDLFTGFDTTPKWSVDWQKKEAIKVFQALGFNTKAISKITGKETDSVLEKNLKTQKGIDDGFLDLYFKYQECYKVCSSFGQGHLDAINPVTGRLHTVFKQLGAASGRMSCGSQQNNIDLAKLKGILASRCVYPNLQQLPSNKETRSCFVAPEGYKFVSCDYSAQEGRVQGDIYNDEAILKMYREGIDGHSMYAKIFFKEELKDIDVHDVKKLRPDLRTKAKGPEFALAYGGGIFAIKAALNCTDEEANLIIKNYEEGFKGTTEFAKRMSKFARANGYIPICEKTGHRMLWFGHKEWLEEQQEFNKEGFWEEYRNIKQSNPDAYIVRKVKEHFKTASKYDRLGRNAPAQGTSAIMTKVAMTNIFNWIVDNNYFNIIHFCVAVHDELNYDYPENITEFPSIVKTKMEESAKLFCTKIDIPAEASIGDHWIH